jgi:prenylcysteine oxidase/farnesylcysteine lyase
MSFFTSYWDFSCYRIKINICIRGPMAGVEDGLWSVKGGNKKIPELLVKKAKANLIEGEVTIVRMVDEDEPTYEIDYKCKNCDNKNEIKTREYDIVVVATPLR